MTKLKKKEKVIHHYVTTQGKAAFPEKKPQSHIWVIEYYDPRTSAFDPVADAHPSRSDARRQLKFDWKFNYPDEKFRVVKYVRA